MTEPQAGLDLDAIVPDDLAITYRGESYAIPGDIDVETTYTLQDLYNGLLQAEGLIEGSEPNSDEARKLTLQLRGEILKLMQVRTPDVKEVPGGSRGLTAIALAILGQLGFVIPDVDAAEGNGGRPRPPTRRPPAKKKAKKAR